MKKILFILKERFYHKSNVKSYGLINSATQIVDYLNESGYQAKAVSVINENGIDKEVYGFKPDVVVIEALWVCGEKLKELIELKRYQKIKWIVRIHSDIGYLSAETMALKYVNDYIALNKSNLVIAPNNEKFTEYLSNGMNYTFKCLPNIITIRKEKNNPIEKSDVMNIGCFGALRILKNQTFQALCAIKAANILGKTLHFHINTDVFNYVDSEEKMNPVLKNLEELFKYSKHKLIEHGWKENNKFQKLIKNMDFGMQLSFTESFNIVTADFVNNNKLILVSDAINWMPNIFKTSTTNYFLVTMKIIMCYRLRNIQFLKRLMRRSLIKHNKHSKKIWADFMINNN